jgi:hypothetical protein
MPAGNLLIGLTALASASLPLETIEQAEMGRDLWRVAMRPAGLTAEQGIAAKPGSEFKDCATAAR